MTPSHKDEATDAVSLEPCPLCGGKAEIWRAQDNGFTKPLKAWIACMNRCCAFITQEHTTNEEAITAWNRRVSTNKDETIAKASAEAIALIDELNERKHSRVFYGIDQALHSKLCTVRATLARSLTSTKKEG